jgi:hypothetical protein
MTNFEFKDLAFEIKNLSLTRGNGVHHFVPRWYLRQWSNNGKLIWGERKDETLVIHRNPVGIKKAGALRGLNSIDMRTDMNCCDGDRLGSLTLEVKIDLETTLFDRIDNRLVKRHYEIIRCLDNKNGEKLAQRTVNDLIDEMVWMELRNIKTWRKNYELDKNVWDEVYENIFPHLQQNFGDLEKEWVMTNIFPLMLLQQEGEKTASVYRNAILRNKTIAVAHITDDLVITSDVPCDHIRTPKILYPISPHYLLIVGDEGYQDKHKRVFNIDNQSELILENVKLQTNGMIYCFFLTSNAVKKFIRQSKA